MGKRVVRLAVITDFHELEAAMDHCKNTLNLPLDFQYQHMPFRLISHGCIPPGQTTNRTKFYTCQLGTERAASIHQAVTKWSEEKSIKIAWDGVIGHTGLAHRLVYKAAQLGGQEALRESITATFYASLVHGKDISDPKVLAEVAESVGFMTKDEAMAFLDGNEFGPEVTKVADAARAKGITGVPVTIIDGKWAVSGGQSSDVFVQIFKKLAACSDGSSPNHLPGPAVVTQICA